MATTKATLLGHRSATSFSDLTLSGDLTVNGTTTTLDTAVQNVDKLEIGASSTDYGAKINQASTGNILQLQDGGTDVMVVKDGGNVGIGVSDPDVELEIKKSSGNAGLAINAGDGNDPHLYFRSGDANDFAIYVDGSETNDPLKFYDYASSSNMMTLVNGKVGIGTDSPDSVCTLHVDSTNHQPLVVNTTASGGGGMILQHNGTYKGHIGTAGSSHLTGSSTDDILVRAANDLIFASGGNNERMRIESNGKIEVQNQQINLISHGLVAVGGSGSGSWNFSVDIPIDLGNQVGGLLFCHHYHYGLTDYGASLIASVGVGSGGYIERVAVDHTTTAGGSWSVSKVDAGTIRVTKNGGTYAGSGNYQIGFIGHR